MVPPTRQRPTRWFVGAGLVAFAAFALWFFLFMARPVERPTVAHPSVPADTPAARVEPDEPADEPAEAIPEVAPDTRWPAHAPRTVLGRVTDPSGQPLPGARVQVEDGGRVIASARTDVQGTFRLRDIPARPTRLRAEAVGFAPRIEEKPRFPAQREVRHDLVLEPLEGLRGLVQAGGIPVEGAQISLLNAEESRPVGWTRSDEGGRFYLAWPEGGATRVFARHGQHGQATAEVSGPGEVLLELPAGGYLEGRVVDQSGDGVERFSISASPLVYGGGGPPAQSFESEDGHFRLGPLAAGELEIWAAAEGYQPAEKQGIQLADGQTIEGLVLTLKASVILEGRVTDARTRLPVEGASVIPAEWQSGALAESVGTETDADGHYRLDALPGSRTSIRVKAEGYRSVLIGGVEGRPGTPIRRDFALTPQPNGQRPATELTGVGAVLRGHPDGVAIGDIIPGGPAEGTLQSGDVVVAVDGEPVRGREMGTVAQAIRGEEGSEVELMVRRGGEGDPQRIILKRGRVTLANPHHQRN